MQRKDGGPAFPHLCSEHSHGTPGMTLRDWFAGQALVALITAHPDADCGPYGFALDAYTTADAMLRARNGGDNDT